MQVVGFNTWPKVELKILPHMWTEPVSINGVDEGRFLDEQSKSAILEVEKRFKEILKNKNVKVAPLTESSEGMIVQKGMAYHAVTSRDSIQNLKERITSIADNGILACEWFGLAYIENEVPFRASFHNVYKTMPVKNLKSWAVGNTFISPLDHSDLLFFVDYENEALKPLTNIDPSNVKLNLNNKLENIKEGEIIGILNKLGSRGMIYTDKLKKQIYESKKDHALRLNKNAASDKPKKIYLDSLDKIIEEYGSTENFIRIGSKTDYDKLDKYVKFIPGGIPPQFINGVMVPEQLEVNTEKTEYVEIVELIKKSFPNAVVFNNTGEEIKIEPQEDMLP